LDEEIARLVKLLEEKDAYLQERERDLADKAEELASQKEELTAAIEELMSKNQSLSTALDQLRVRNYELDQILYRTSHDLRSPLSSIKGIINLMKREPQGEPFKEYCTHVAEKTEQMENLLQSLSSLSKAILEKPRFENIQLKEITHRVIDNLKHLPAWNKVKINYALQVDAITTDPFLITIILESLLSNAFIFRDVQKTGTISIESLKSADRWTLYITDDGDGIEVSVRDHIFEMFYRGSERSTGSGLGLYVARKAAEQLNGTIQVSHETKATRFTVTLPLLIIGS
jgi:signal transduction histidine kinase